MFSPVFFLNSILLGVGLAMDAFSVSCANGLREPNMKKNKICLIALIFALFQIVMPLIGWLCIHTIASVFVQFQKFIPWIALLLLSFIGIKMLIEGINKNDDDDNENIVKIGILTLIIQGIATSIDALSVGFTISELDAFHALIEALIIGVVTFIICVGGVAIGKKFGTLLKRKANVLGGLILIAIGIEIFISGIIK